MSLSTQGEVEAQRLATRFAGIKLAAIYSSPLERAQQTARPLAKSMNLEVNTSDAFNEVNFGEWTGMDLDELHHIPEWTHWNMNRSCTRPPSGEMLIEIQQRVVTKVEVLRCEYPENNVALVSHSDTIRAAMSYYLGMPVDLMLRIEISPASVSVVRITDTKPEVLCLNDTGDLALL